MSKTLTILGNRRFLFWIRFDGFFFGEMAKGSTGRGVLQTFQLFLADSLRCEVCSIKLAPCSRTDKSVHALRMPLFAQLPPELHWIDESESSKSVVLSQFNSLSADLSNDALSLLDYHGVAPGFNSRKHVIYRKYVYRICVPKHCDVVERLAAHGATLPSFSEANYAWIVPPAFDAHVAAKVCAKLEGRHQNYATFFKHPDKLRHNDVDYRSTDRLISYMRVEQGEPYRLPNDEFDYFNIVIVSSGFLREQVRRLMRVMVQIATGQQPLSFLDELLRRRDPRCFFQNKLTAAPPGGLFLADVVYDPRMYERPVPDYPNPWDLGGGEECMKVPEGED